MGHIFARLIARQYNSYNMIVFFQSTTDIRLYKQLTLWSKAGGYII